MSMSLFFRRLKKAPVVMIIAIVIASFGLQWRGMWNKDHMNDAIRSDGIGYYSYLPALFIYHDATYHFCDTLWTKYPNLMGTGGSAFCNEIDGRKVNKYFAGEAVLTASFFLVSHLVAKMTGYPADGYSPPYSIGICLASLFYLTIGLIFLMRLLRLMKVKDRYIAFVIFLIFWATNLSQYAMWEPTMSHTYSFAMVSIFLFFAQRLMIDFRKKDLIWLGISLGLIVILRPVNLLVVLILPFLAGDWQTLRNFFLNFFRARTFMIGSVLTFFVVVFIQLLAYKIQSGHWYVYAYTKETFHFDKPHFFECLFSYSNGAFVYAPLLFVALFGIIPILRKNLFKGISFLLFFTILVYVISCWWYWTYAGAFGMRPLVEYYSLFAVLLCALISSFNGFFRWTFALFIFIPLAFLLQLQLWQFKYGIISWQDMTKEKYWKVFLQTGPQFMWINTEPPMQDVPANAVKIISRDFAFDLPDPLIRQYYYYDFDDKHTSFVVRMGVPNNDSPFITGMIGELTADTTLDLHNTWVDVSLLCRSASKNTDAMLISSFSRKDSCMYWVGYPLVRQIDERWKWIRVHYFFKAPADLRRTDTFLFQVTKEDESEFKFDDMNISFYHLP